MRRRCHTGVGLLLALAATYVASAPKAATQQRKSPPMTLHLAFHRLPYDVLTLLVRGRYALLELNRGYPNLVVVDDQTGRRSKVKVPAGCGIWDGAFGPPWILFNCTGQAPKLYDVRTHTWHRFRCGALCDGTNLRGEAMGAHWVLFSQQPFCDPHTMTCGDPQLIYVNVLTGKARRLTPSTTSIADLNSPTLVRRVCSPLQAPLTFYGKFAVVQGFGLYVERCNSRTRIALATTPYAGSIAANTQAAGFCTFGGGTAASPYAGVFLPSLRPFTAPLPSNLQCPDGLGPHRLYARDTSGRGVWAAAFPSQPAKRAGTRR